MQVASLLLPYESRDFFVAVIFVAGGTICKVGVVRVRPPLQLSSQNLKRAGKSEASAKPASYPVSSLKLYLDPSSNSRLTVMTKSTNWLTPGSYNPTKTEVKLTEWMTSPLSMWQNE